MQSSSESIMSGPRVNFFVGGACGGDTRIVKTTNLRTDSSNEI
jgi:hypothetical protein